MKNLPLKQLEKDKDKIEQLIQETDNRLTQERIQLYRLDGVRAYLQDNINKLKGGGEE